LFGYSPFEPDRPAFFNPIYRKDCTLTAAEALAYNSLVQSWPEIQRLAQEKKHSEAAPGELF
jgi:hypothetical protein